MKFLYQICQKGGKTESIIKGRKRNTDFKLPGIFTTGRRGEKKECSWNLDTAVMCRI